MPVIFIRSVGASEAKPDGPRDLWKIPAAKPPPGVTPDFVHHHHQSRAVQLRIACISCVIIAGLFVLLRMFSRARLVRKLWWDDYTCVIALLLSIAFSVACMKISYQGVGVHQWDIPLAMYINGIKTEIVIYSIYSPFMFFVKTSILLLYIRLFEQSGVSPTFTRTVWAVILVIFAYHLAIFFPPIFNCSPRGKRWNPKLEGTCVNLWALAISSAVINIITDLLILVLPIGPVWRLQLRKKQKITVLGIFATGSFVCIISVIRLKYFIDTYKNPNDESYLGSYTTIWTIVEADLSIVCGCLPALKPFLQHFFPRIFNPSSMADTYPRHQQGPTGYYANASSSNTTTRSSRWKFTKNKSKGSENSRGDSQNSINMDPRKGIVVTQKTEAQSEDAPLGDGRFVFAVVDDHQHRRRDRDDSDV